MAELIGFSDFRFNSLRKFMSPFYATLNRHLELAPKEKETFVQTKIVPEFYKRLRIYRNLELEDIAQSSNVNVTFEDLSKFERGDLKVTPEIDRIYCRACYGDNERIYFWHQIRAFYNPSIRESEIAMAKDVFIKYGLTSAYVDYQDLNGKRGTVLEFKR